MKQILVKLDLVVQAVKMLYKVKRSGSLITKVELSDDGMETVNML